MRKQTAETIRIESEQAGWKPILAKVKEGDKWTWQIWGIEPTTQTKTFIVSREQWEQQKQYAAYFSNACKKQDENPGQAAQPMSFVVWLAAQSARR